MTHETQLSVGKIAISEKNGKSEQFDSRDESFCGRLLKNFDYSTQKYSVEGREMKPRHYSHFTRECFPYIRLRKTWVPDLNFLVDHHLPHNDHKVAIPAFPMLRQTHTARGMFIILIY